MAASLSAPENPFIDSIVRDPWSDVQAEVPDIGRAAFEACRREIENVRGFRISRSVLLHGPSGCGKTHLVARVRRYLEERARPRWLDSVFISVQMQTSPGRIWRHLRRRFAEDLLRRPAAGPSQLDRIIFARMAEAESRGGYLEDWRQKILVGSRTGPAHSESLAFALWTIVDRLDRGGALDMLRGDIYEGLAGDANMPVALQRVLRHAAQRRHPGLAHAWLRGESLPEPDLRILETERGEGAEEDEEPEDEAREVVLNLIRLAAVPVVFCLDQVEALESTPAGFFALGNAATSLHDLTSNALVICCIQSNYIDKLPAALGAGYARISESVQELAGVHIAEAEQLIRARLGDSAAEYHDRVRIENFEDLFRATGTTTPRRVISRAAELFERGNPAAERQTVEDSLAERWERYLERAERTNRPEHSDQILEHGLPLLLQLGPAKRVIGNGSRDVQFTFSGAGAPAGVSICNQANMRSLAGRLRRLRAEMLPPDRLVVVRDSRLPIGRHAQRTRQYLDELTARGARIVHPTVEALAALDALRILLSEARSGDLASGDGPIAPSTVEQWLSSNLPLSLSDLIRDLSLEGSASHDVDLRENLIDFLEKHLIATLAEAARAVASPESVVTDCAAANPGVIGYLAGPPPLLYRASANAAAGVPG